LTEESKKEVKTVVVVDEPVARILDLQSRYGIDQETMIIYLNSLNLMNILNLVNRRYGTNPGQSLQMSGVPQLPALSQDAAAGSGMTWENMAGMLLKLLGNQGQDGSAQGGQGINPSVLLNMLSALYGQNLDLNHLMKMLPGLMGFGAKPAPKTASQDIQQASRSPAAGGSSPEPEAKDSGTAGGSAGGQPAARHEVPKIMKWDRFDECKKA